MAETVPAKDIEESECQDLIMGIEELVDRQKKRNQREKKRRRQVF